MILSAPSFPPVVGESGPARVARIVRAYDGCSLDDRRDDLAALVGRGVDDESVVSWETNCMTFALGVLAAAGLDFPALRVPLVNGREGKVLEDIGHRFDAWRVAARSETPPVGALLWYESIPRRQDAEGRTIWDDHVRFMLEPPDLIGEGGGARNRITVGRTSPYVSSGRLLVRWLDPAALSLPDAHVGDDGGLGGAPTDPAPAA